MSAQLPKITIITPSFNQGVYIEDTILSVLEQQYPNLEYIVIDGGSTDNSLDIIRKYQHRITYWVSEKDSGQSNAINKGFRVATGEIINWLNSDDQLMPGSLHAVAKMFIENPHVIMAHGRIEYFGNVPSFLSKNLPVKDLETRYAAHICMPQPACFYRKRLLDEQGGLDESLHFSMDTDLFVRAGLHYPILQTEEILARFRLHEASKSVSSFNKTFLSDNKTIFSRVLTTLGAEKSIARMKAMELYDLPTYLYKSPLKEFDEDKLLFYFLQHRLSTLYFHGEKKEFRRLFAFWFKYFPWEAIFSRKIVLYRFSLFLPKGFWHKITRARNRSGS